MEIKAQELLVKLDKLTKAQGKDAVNSKSFIFHKGGIMSQSGDNFINIPHECIGNFAVSSEKLLPFLKKNAKKTFELTIESKELKLSSKGKEITFPLQDINVKIENFLPHDLEPTPVSEDFVVGLLTAARICPKHLSQSVDDMFTYVYVEDDTIMASDSMRFVKFDTEISVNGRYFLRADTVLKYGSNDIVGISSSSEFVYLYDKDGAIYGIPTATGIYEIKDIIIPHMNEVLAKGNDVILPLDIAENLNDVIAIQEGNTKVKVTLSEDKIQTIYKTEGVSYKAEKEMEYKDEKRVFYIDPVLFKEALLTNYAVIYGTTLCFESEKMTYLTSVKKD